ncbi:MAG TPA: sigma 54-interacting transcriptional regulator [Candidatus Sulfotelmatobacter sp.]|nr:sigma 54-interacting transcriptional regulator [Candidatus Sulfotelmatobacter sp.]
MATQPIAPFPNPAFVYGQSADLQSLNVLAAEIASTDIPILLVGESGTGKDVYARLIHRLSGGNEKSFVRVNCGALDAGQMLNDVREAFEKEADTTESRRTVFLDGVHELDAACQRALLSLLPDGERKSDTPALARVISSTSCKFEKEIEAGRFRLELYFRLNGVILRLPALRERKEDIPDLLECFVLKHANDLRKSAPEIGREARKLLFSYHWPGNIRELENLARKMVAVGDADLALADLRHARETQPAEEAASTQSERSGSPGITSLKVAARAASRKTERELILKALEHTHWNRKRAARNLQISYKSLLYKIKQIGAQVPFAEENEEKP